MNAADIMTAPITVQQDASLRDAIRLMLEQRIGGLPVVERPGELVGLITEGDLLRRAEIGTDRHRPQWLDFLRGPGQHAAEYVHTHSRKVADLMTRDVISVGEQTPLPDIVQLMQEKRIKRLPVLASHRLVGIVSRAGLLRALFAALQPDAAPEPADATLRDQVLAAIREQNWGGRGQFTVLVIAGTAYLEGVVYDPRESDAMRVAAENVPGIHQVRSNLTYIDPTAGLVYGLST